MYISDFHGKCACQGLICEAKSQEDTANHAPKLHSTIKQGQIMAGLYESRVYGNGL